jgi:cytosine/adenosine deaminase-related metal-dependent hydrolase
MGIVLEGATLVELEPARVELGALRIEGNHIVGRGKDAAKQEGDEVYDLRGKVVMPGLVSTHHLLYSNLLRGAPRAGDGFAAELAARHKLEEALTPDDIEAAAAASAVEGLLSGVTTVFDFHFSPRMVQGSLGRVAQGLSAVGLRFR